MWGLFVMAMLSLALFMRAIRQDREQRIRDQEQQSSEERAKFVRERRAALDGAICEMCGFLSDLYEPHALGVAREAFEDLSELAPIAPIAGILCAQGSIGAAQSDYLTDYFNVHSSRYNLHQFTKAAVEREGVYARWHTLAALESTFCGQIWHTLIELICRSRDPQLMQKTVNMLGRILHHFSLLDQHDTASARICCGNMVSCLNTCAESDQQTPYLHAVMLLQSELAKKTGGAPQAFVPCAEEMPAFDMDGRTGAVFFVHRTDDLHFAARYAVRDRSTPDDADLIWQLPLDGGNPVVFFSE